MRIEIVSSRPEQTRHTRRWSPRGGRDLPIDDRDGTNRRDHSETRRTSSVRPRRRPRRRRLVLILAVLVAGGGAAGVSRWFHRNESFPIPGASTLAALSIPQRIVAIATSQVGYAADPADSYCNKYSAYWDSGSGGCPGGETSERWCADFAAWTWQEAGVQFSYGFGRGELNAGAVSFYEWGIESGRWHPAASGFVASPGDVAVYGLVLGAAPSAAHVAIVTSDSSVQMGPDVVNGDGDQTGFSVVEAAHDQRQVEVGEDSYLLSGYVSVP